MFPCGFEPCFLLEEGVGDGQGVFCAQFEEQPPVVVAVADSMPPKHSWSNGVVSAYPCIEVSHDEDLVRVFSFLQEGPQLTVEGFLRSGVCL